MAQLQQQRHTMAHKPEKCCCHSVLWEMPTRPGKGSVFSTQQEFFQIKVTSSLSKCREVLALIYLLVPKGGSSEGTQVLLGTLPLALAVQLHSGTERESATALRRKHARRLARKESRFTVGCLYPPSLPITGHPLRVRLSLQVPPPSLNINYTPSVFSSVGSKPV